MEDERIHGRPFYELAHESDACRRFLVSHLDRIAIMSP